jgi:plasmid stabilization system protein ParE
VRLELVYKIKHLPSAISDIFDIEDYLNEHSPTAADRFTEDVDRRIEALTDHPQMCPPYQPDPFFRRMAIGDYLLFYSIDEKQQLIAIHRIFHHSRDIDRHMSDYKKTSP